MGRNGTSFFSGSGLQFFPGVGGKMYLTLANEINSHRLTGGKEWAQTGPPVTHLKSPYLDTIVKFMSKSVSTISSEKVCEKFLFVFCHVDVTTANLQSS